MGFTEFPLSEGGRGAVALQDIPVRCLIIPTSGWLTYRLIYQEGHTLFAIPRSLTLSTRTSSLPQLFGPDQWKERKLDQGWVGLILCMMWEVSRGSSSTWAEYLGKLLFVMLVESLRRC